MYSFMQLRIKGTLLDKNDKQIRHKKEAAAICFYFLIYAILRNRNLSFYTAFSISFAILLFRNFLWRMYFNKTAGFRL